MQDRIAAEAAARSFAAALDTAPAETRALRESVDAEMPAAPTAESLGIDGSTTLADLEQRLDSELAKRTANESRLAELATQIEIQEGRPTVAREQIDQLRRSREKLSAAVDAAPVLGEPQILIDARRLVAAIRSRTQDAEINKLEQELLSHGVRLDLLRARRDMEEHSHVEVEIRVELLRGIVNDRRQMSAMLAQQAAAEAELAASDKPAVVRELAVGNAGLTREMASIAIDIQQTTAQLDQARTETDVIEGRFTRAQHPLEVAGLSRAIGQLLVEERRNLPRVSQYRAQVRARSRTLADAGLAQLHIDEQRRELASPDAKVRKVMAEVAATVTGEQELADIQSELRRLLTDRRDLLISAEKTFGDYLQLLGDLDMAQRRLLESADQYKEFLDQNLLWTPSAPVAFTGVWQDSVPAVARAVSLESWLTTTATLYDALRENMTQAVACLVVLVSLLLVRRPLGQRYKTASALVGRPSTDRISLTLAALAIAATRALPLPLLFGAISWFLRDAIQPTVFSLAVASGLGVLAPFLYNVLLFRVLAATDGVLQVHFGWPKEGLAVIRRQLDRLSAIAAPLVFATVFFYASEFASDRATMGRMAFVALMAVLVMTFHPLAHPESGVVATYYHRRAGT